MEDCQISSNIGVHLQHIDSSQTAASGWCLFLAKSFNKVFRWNLFTLDLFHKNPFKLQHLKLVWKFSHCGSEKWYFHFLYIWLQFDKCVKSARRRHCHKIIKTNLKTLVSPLLIHPQGCQKKRHNPLNMLLEIWCPKIDPKLKKIQKSFRKKVFWHVFFSIFKVFWSFYNFGSMLAQALNSVFCKQKFDFLNPLGPLGFWIHEEDLKTMSLVSRVCVSGFDK